MILTRYYISSAIHAKYQDEIKITLLGRMVTSLDLNGGIWL